MSIGGRPAIPVAVQREFWAAVRSGLVVAEAADAVGVSKTVEFSPRGIRGCANIFAFGSVRRKGTEFSERICGVVKRMRS